MLSGVTAASPHMTAQAAGHTPSKKKILLSSARPKGGDDTGTRTSEPSGVQSTTAEEAAEAAQNFLPELGAGCVLSFSDPFGSSRQNYSEMEFATASRIRPHLVDVPALSGPRASTSTVKKVG